MRGMVVKLGFRNVFRNGKRTSIIILTIAICTAVIMTIGGIFHHMFNGFKKEAIASGGHISLTSNSESNIVEYEKLITEVEKIDGVHIVVPQADASGILGFGEETAIFDGIGVNYKLENKVKSFIYPKKDIKAEEQNGVVLGTLLASNLGAKVGDTVNILIASSGTRSAGVSLPVTGIVSTEAELLDRVFVKFPLEVILDKLGSNSIGLIKVYLKDETTISQVQKDIDILLIKNPKWNINISQYNEPGSLYESAINVYMSNYYFILVVVVLTLLFAVSSTITMSIMERVSELGTVRSFGVSKKSIASMFIWEGTFLGSAGFILGLGLTLLIILVTNLMGGIYLPPPPTTKEGAYVFVEFAKSALLLSFCVSIVVSIIASFISTLKVSSLTIIEELRHV